MANQIIYSAVFIRKAKAYKKKYHSIVEDLRELEKSLLKNPEQGNNLGSGLFKVRLAVKSKGKGKSGGLRIITFLLSQTEKDFIINVLTIYDKSEESSIDKKVLQQIIKSLYIKDFLFINLYKSYQNRLTLSAKHTAMNVSLLANTLIGSEIIKIGNEVNDMKRKGAQIANLTIGDFDSSIFPIPKGLEIAIVKAYHDGHTNYPPADGILALRETITGVLQNRYQLTYAVNDILVAGGSRPLIYALYLALIDAGDTVIYPAPSWNNNHYCHLSSAKGVAITTTVENNFMPTAAQLKPHLKGATLLALCSPLNPTGTMFTQQQLEEICDIVIEENQSRNADEKPLYIMYDQIYSLLTFGKEHVNPVSLRPELKDYVIYIDGISKCLAATGVRVGWAFGPENVIGKMKSILGHIGAWAPKAEQVAVAEYFKDNKLVDSFLTNFKTQVQESLEALYNGFKELRSSGFKVDAVVPMGAIYLTLKIDYIGKTTPEGELLKNSADINFYLIKAAQAAIVPFSAFGNEESMPWFRASVGGCSLEDIKNMVPRIAEALGKLK